MLHNVAFLRRRFPNASARLTGVISVALAVLVGAGLGLLMAR